MIKKIILKLGALGKRIRTVPILILAFISFVGADNSSDILKNLENPGYTESQLIQALSSGEQNVYYLISQRIEKHDIKKAQELLSKALFNSDVVVRRNVSLCLYRIADENVRGVLEKALKDKDVEVRRYSMRALQKIHSPASLIAVKNAMKDNDYQLRLYALYYFENLNNEETVPELINALSDESWYLRRRAAGMLYYKGDKRAKPALLKVLKDGNKRVRQNAAAALITCGDENCVEGLKKALEEEHLPLIENALEAISKHAKEEISMPILKRFLNHKSIKIKKTAAGELYKKGDLSGVELLIEEVENGKEKDYASRHLKKITGKDFKKDAKLWRDWLKNERKRK
ncbi:MAG: HEAT repeat domain-containing protein [bacterium]